MTVEHCQGTSAFASDRQISECTLPEVMSSEHKQVILGMLTNGHCCCFFR